MRPDGVRLDLLTATGHAQRALEDYAQVRGLGMHTVRDGVRWHLVERPGRRYCWDSLLPMVRAAERVGVQVIWDLCHYGWPDHLDVWSAAWVEHFADFAAAVTRLLRDESDAVPCFCPINEISYWAWAGGEVGRMNPAAHGRGTQLKRQLVRAYLAAVDAVRSVEPRSRFIVSEPLIHVLGGGAESVAAEHYRIAQFEAHDMLSGRLAPELGGRDDCLDLIGVNYYPDNQWYLRGGTIPFGHHAYRPLSELLGEVWQRYGRRLLISETGAEGKARPYWLHHVCGETLDAIRAGIPVEGVCLYPVLDYPGWDNERHCPVGLLSGAQHEERQAFGPLLEELRRQQGVLRRSAAGIGPGANRCTG